MKDLFGKAILDYAQHGCAKDLVTWTSISDRDTLPVAYLFRPFSEMPRMEQQALNLAHGRILDVGCGAGSHSLHVMQQGNDVTPLDLSANAIRACHLRGLPQAIEADVFEFSETGFDTILMLMNGTGIAGTLPRLEVLLRHLGGLLTENGQILIDSSDIRYMFDDDEQSSLLARVPYYGELHYYLSYKGVREVPTRWLYTDFDTLSKTAWAAGLRAELVAEGDHFDFLARLKHAGR